jgi:hypothetical protein
MSTPETKALIAQLKTIATALTRGNLKSLGKKQAASSIINAWVLIESLEERLAFERKSVDRLLGISGTPGAAPCLPRSEPASASCKQP